MISPLGNSAIAQLAIAQIPSFLTSGGGGGGVGLPSPREVKVDKRKTWKQIEAEVAADSMVERTESRPWALLEQWNNEEKLRRSGPVERVMRAAQQQQRSAPTLFGISSVSQPPVAPKSQVEMMMERFRNTKRGGPSLEDVLMNWRKIREKR